MQIAPQLEEFARRVRIIEKAAGSNAVMLDTVMDLYNDLTEWATSTEHDEAAMEVMAILEQYVQKSKANSEAIANGVPADIVAEQRINKEKIK